ncbi:hypothetical protein [Brachyspira hyodysenteriae]|uniref:hypothetical protein n=1 Tax=Brachyspira hyodysenteriae TaxID=159 RepID=UPI000A85BA82|nr:hypothetical protein [Brachyspira hyodysenteriae]
MTNNVFQFINRKEFFESKYPNISCYSESLVLDDNSFSKEEKVELFYYFFDLRKKLELPYFKTYCFTGINTITDSVFYHDILNTIVNSVVLEIESIFNKTKLNSQDIFDLFDYILCINKHINKSITIKYLNRALIVIPELLKNNYNENEEKIILSIEMLYYIDINICDIENSLFYIISNINDITHIRSELSLRLSVEIGDILEKYTNIDNVNENIILFTLHSYNMNINNYDYLYYTVASIKNILSKISNIQLKLKIFSYTFPNFLKDIQTNNSYYLFIHFILIKEFYKEDYISKLESNQKDFLFKYIAFHFVDSDFKLKIENEEIDLSELKDAIFNYIIGIFEISEIEDNFVYWQIIRNYIDSQEKYDKCSKKLKKYRIRLIFSSDDPIYNIKESDKEINNTLEMKKEQLRKSKILKYKIEKYKEDKEYEKINCIKRFFDVEYIKKDIEFVLKQFNNNDSIDIKDLLILNDKYEYPPFEGKMEEIIDGTFIIPIFNQFCIFYIGEIIYFFFRNEEKININLLFKSLIDNWSNFYILHLYNYLIEINKFNYPFSNEEKEIIRNYFKNTNIQFPKYILIHLEKVFGFDIDLERFSDEKSIIEILSYTYEFINESPKQIVIFNNPLIKFEQGIIDTSLEFETFDLSYIVKKLNIDKYYMLDLCLKNINIEKSIYFASSQYYFLLSTINIYNSIDNKIKYTDKIKEIILEYFKKTLNRQNNDMTFISNLLIDNVIKLNLMNDLLKLINHSYFIGVGHYNIISQWQYNIIFHNLYNRDLLDIIYKIREKIRKKDINIIKYSNRNNSYNFEEYCNKLKKSIDDIINIKDFNSQVKALSAVSNDINTKLEVTLNKEVLYYEHDNMSELLIFVNKNTNIFEYFCNLQVKDYYIHQKSIRNFDYIFNNIEKYKTAFINITYIISQIYDKLENKINYPIETVYTPVFELRVIIEHLIDKIIKTDYYFDEQVYDNLLKVTELEPKTEDEKEFLKNLEKRLIYKKTLLISPIKIYKDKSLSIYFIENKHGDKTSYDNLEKLLQNLNNRFNKTAKISRILEFEHLVKDIENRCITMSHPYLFEDDNENQYDIKNKLYISCFSYSIGNENAYAWWKIYGSKTKFRMTIDIKDFIKSIMSILYNHNVEIYLGSLYYMDKEKIKSKNENVWDFFDKRNDFKFENELRLIIEINNEIKNTDSGSIKIENIKGLPILCSFPIKELDMYKNMSTDEKDIIFHPYDKTLLYKDKKAMLSILEELKSKI